MYCPVSFLHSRLNLFAVLLALAVILVFTVTCSPSEIRRCTDARLLERIEDMSEEIDLLYTHTVRELERTATSLRCTAEAQTSFGTLGEVTYRYRIDPNGEESFAYIMTYYP